MYAREKSDNVIRDVKIHVLMSTWRKRNLIRRSSKLHPSSLRDEHNDRLAVYYNGTGYPSDKIRVLFCKAGTPELIVLGYQLKTKTFRLSIHSSTQLELTYCCGLYKSMMGYWNIFETDSCAF